MDRRTTNLTQPLAAMMLRLLWAFGVVFIAALAMAPTASGEDTFSVGYSGRLIQANGAPVEGPVDIEVSFWTAASDGQKLGRSISKTGVNLVNGVFAIELPLSGADVAAIFDDGPNEVYIEVNSAGKVYPRQKYMFTPLALRIPVDTSHFAYDQSTGKLRIKMDQSASDGSVLTSDGHGGITWKKIEAAQIIARGENNAAPSDKQVLTYANGQWIAADVAKATGFVTGVTGIAPVTVSGSGTAPTISISQASGTSAGYLSSTDWNNFNTKQSALGFSPVNKSGDTLTGSLMMADSSVIGVSKNSNDPAVSGAGDKGKVWFNSTSNELKYFDGTVVKSLATAGSSITAVTGGTGISVATNANNATIALSDTGVTPGSYTRATITVDQQGRLTAASSGAPITDSDIAASANIAQNKISGLATALAGKEPTVTSGTDTQYWRGDKSWQDLNTTAVAEGTNQYFTPARAISSLSSTAPITYSTVTGTIGISQASGSGNGYLSSTDWTTFNNKQVALGFSPVNKAGDTLTGALNINGQDLTATGNLIMANSKVLVLSANSSDPSLNGNADKGKLWFNSTSNELRYFDGSAIKTLGTAGSGLQSFNGQSTNSQTLEVPGSSGTAPNWSSNAGAHTLNIPLASASSVTAGLISNTDYTSFSNKVANVAQGTGIAVNTASGTATVSLATTGTAGSYTKVTTDSYGRVTDGTSLSASDLPPHSATLITTGELPASRGGTGLSATPTNGQILIGSNGTFALGTLSAGGNGGVTIANSAGAISLDTAQDIRASASPTFTGLISLSVATPLITQSGTAAPAVSAAGQGRIYFDQTSNEFKISQNGGSYTKLASGGTVTNISTGTGLSGGPITSTGTISLSNTTVTAGSYTRANITVDAQGRLTGAQNAAAIVDADISASAAIAQAKVSGLTTDLAGKEPTISAGTNTQYWRGDKSWQTLNTTAVAEGTNQYFTPARAISSLSSSAPITYSTVTGTIGISQASGSGNGYLSSTDWTSFNNKQAALGFSPINKAGDTLTGALNLNGQDLISTGNLTMATSKVFGVSNNTSDPSVSGTADKGKLWFNSTTNELKYFDGSVIKTLGTAGSGLQSFNGQSTNSQTLAVPGSTGTAPNWSSNAGVHTLNLPLAAAAGVTAGLISNSDHVSFSNKVANVAQGTGISVATASGTATVSLAAIGSLGTYTKVTTDTYGRVSAGTTLTTADLPPFSAGLINAGTLNVANGGTGSSNLSANAVLLGNGTSALQTVAPGSNGNVLTSNGTTWQSTAIPATNWAAPGTIGSTTPNSGDFTSVTSKAQAGYEAKPYGTSAGNTGEVRFTELAAGGTNYVGFKAPDAIGANKIWVLPVADGTAGQILKTDGAGNLGWTSDGGGTVTSVTATAPISVTNGTTTPAISMPQANSSTNGYLAATDWTTFNGKQAAGSYLTSLTGDLTTSGFNSGSATATLASVALAGTSTKVTYDVKGRVTSGTSLVAADIPPLSASMITSGTLGVANGGTGLVAAPTAGQIPIGNGSGYTLSTLSAGTGISISSSAGSVTVSATADAATKVSQTGDTMTGSLSLPANGLILGSNQLVAANGNVGVGSTAPVSPLQVARDYTSTNIDFAQLTLTGATNPARGLTMGYDSTNNYAWIYSRESGVNARNLVLQSPGGNVGVGTTSPLAKLHIQNTGTANPTMAGEDSLVVSSTGGTGYWNAVNVVAGDQGVSRVKFSSGTANGAGAIGYFNQTNSMNFVTNNSERMRIDSNGNVGIGTTAPIAPLSFAASLGEKITLWGTSTSANYGIGIQNALLQIHTDVSISDIAFGYGASSSFTELMRIKGNGNVGIGTSSPGYLLDIAGASAQTVASANPFATGHIFRKRGTTGDATSSISSSSELGYIYFQGWDGTGYGNGSLILSSSTENFSATAHGSKLTFWTSANGSAGVTERMVISSSGNVGIGTTAPLAALDIRAPSNPWADNRFNLFSFDTSPMAANVGGGIGFGGYYTSNSTWAEWAGIKSYKDNGTSGDYGAGLALSTRANGGNTTERLRITSTGNVGIGTTSPLFKSHLMGISNAPSLSAPAGIAAFDTNSTVELTMGGYVSSPFGFWLQTKDNQNSGNGTGNSYPLVLNPLGGNVGIGSSAPTQTLDVAGNIKTTGAVVYNTLQDFRMVYREDFESTATGWTNNTRTTCGAATILGGYNTFAGGSVYKDYDLTGISHTEVMVKFTYYFIDTWDGESAYAQIGGIGTFYRSHLGNAYGNTNICGVATPEFVTATEHRISHTGNSLRVLIGSTLDQVASDESFGVDNVEIWVR